MGLTMKKLLTLGAVILFFLLPKLSYGGWGLSKFYDTGVSCQYPNDAYTVLQVSFDGTDGSSTFTDDSASSHTVTGLTNAQVDTSNPKMGTGALLVNSSTSDYVSVPDSDNFNWGSDGWTVDFWVKFNELPVSGQTDVGLWGQYESGVTVNQFTFRQDASGYYYFELYSINAYLANVFHTYIMYHVSKDQWYHVEVGSSSARPFISIDGKYSETSDPHLFPDIIAPFYIGIAVDDFGAASGVTRYFSGLIDEFRVSKGIVRHDEDFIPPSKPYCD